MAIVKISNGKRCVVNFQEKELQRFGGIEARVEIWQKKVFVNTFIPFLTWQGHDRRVAEDLIDALKKICNYGAKAKGVRIGFGAHAHKPTILREDKIRVPVYAQHSEPYVQIERGADGFVKWTVQGKYLNDDLPSLAAYVAAVTQLINYAKETM